MDGPSDEHPHRGGLYDGRERHLHGQPGGLGEQPDDHGERSDLRGRANRHPCLWKQSLRRYGLHRLERMQLRGQAQAHGVAIAIDVAAFGIADECRLFRRQCGAAVKDLNALSDDIVSLSIRAGGK